MATVGFKGLNEQSRALLTPSECGGDLFAGVYMESSLMNVIITINFCCSNLWKSTFITVENSGNFFLLCCQPALC